MTGCVMITEGKALRTFNVWRPVTRGTDAGREGLTNSYENIGTIRGTLAQAKPEEVQRWRQLEHPVSHKIIMRKKPAFDVLPGDVLEYAGRRFYNTAVPYDVGGIGHFTIFYCNERTDIT